MRFTLALAATFVFACSDSVLQQPPITREDSGDFDGGVNPETGAVDAPGDVKIDASGCPAPVTVGPDKVPSGYFPPRDVSFVRAADGDTATFKFPDQQEHIVRLLYINTEESHGDQTTQFGIDTGKIVLEWLKSAKSIKVSPRRSGGVEDKDPYDRWLALVWLDGELWQSRVVREGLSAYYTEFGCAPEPIHSNLLHSEAEANANRRGIWRPGHPTDYRVVLENWIDNACRPNPYKRPYCQ
jgi:micrococcal nuclease